MRLLRRRSSALILGILVLVIGLIGLLVALPQVRSRLGLPGSTHTTPYTNPVFDQDFPDPMVMQASDGFYYGYATQALTAQGIQNIQVARSQDLVRWTALPDALPTKPTWAANTQKFWAPDVSEHDGTYYMYYVAESDIEGLCLAVATAKTPGGPFADSGEPLQCGTGFVNIDPMAFDDPKTGKHLLYWGSGFAPIKVQELASDRLHWAANSTPVDLIYPANNDYEALVEAAFVIEHDGFYYLFYSGNDCCNPDAPHYAVMVARSQNATGPFETLALATGGASSVILEQNQRWLGPGHNAIIRDAAGQDWMLYHAINANNRVLKEFIPGDRTVRRVLLLDRVVYRDGWPHIESNSPSTTQQPGPSVR